MTVNILLTQLKVFNVLFIVIVTSIKKVLFAGLSLLVGLAELLEKASFHEIFLGWDKPLDNNSHLDLGNDQDMNVVTGL